MKNSKIQTYSISTRVLILFVITGILLPVFTLFLSTSGLAATANIQKDNNGNRTIIKSHHLQKSPSSLLVAELAEDDNEEEESRKAFDAFKVNLSKNYSSKDGYFSGNSSSHLSAKKSLAQKPPYILFCSLKIPS